MSTRHTPKWMREAQRRILAQPGITPDLVCPACGRSMYRSDWDVAAGRCVDCATPRAVDDAFASDQPFTEDE